MGDLRRNIVLRGISAEAVNDMVGHEVRIGTQGCRVFVHRRTVPCKYREAACRRPGLMNNLWGVCGVNCEVLPPIERKNIEGGKEQEQAEADNNNTIRVGDTVTVIPNTYQPDRVDPGRKPPPFFIRPADRSAEDVKQMITPTFIVAIFCLIDSDGFQRVEDAYNSVGQRFWSPNAYPLGLLIKAVRIPFLVAVSVALLSIVVGVIFHLNNGT